MRKLKSLILLILSAIAGYSLFSLNLSELYGTISVANPSLVASIFAIELLIVLVSSVKWGMFINSVKKVGYITLMPIFFASEFIAFITPGTRVGGEPYRAYRASKKYGMDLTKSMAATVMDKACDYILFFLISVFSIFALSYMVEVPRMFSFALEAFVFTLSALVFSGYFIEKKLARNNEYLDSLFRFIYKLPFFVFIRNRFSTYNKLEIFCISKIHIFSHQVSEITGNKRRLHIELGISAVRWLLVYLQSYVAFLAFGYNVSIYPVIITVTISMILSYFIAVPAGVGISELSMVSLYSAMGITPSIAVAATALTRSVYYVFGVGISYIVFIFVEGESKGYAPATLIPSHYMPKEKIS